MARSMVVELQPWITIRNDSTNAPIPQPREHWVDASGFDTVMLNVEISSISAATFDLEVQTSITDDPNAMRMLNNGSDAQWDAVTRGTQAGAQEVYGPDAAVPVGRWLRWYINNTTAGYITFRIVAELKCTG